MLCTSRMARQKSRRKEEREKNKDVDRERPESEGKEIDSVKEDFGVPVTSDHIEFFFLPSISNTKIALKCHLLMSSLWVFCTTRVTCLHTTLKRCIRTPL